MLRYENGSDVLIVRQSTRTGPAPEGGETVAVNGRELTVRSYGETTSVTWNCGGRRYAVSGQLSNATLTDVASSVACE